MTCLLQSDLVDPSMGYNWLKNPIFEDGTSAELKLVGPKMA